MTNFEQIDTASQGQGKNSETASRLLADANAPQVKLAAMQSPIDQRTDLCEASARSNEQTIKCANTAQTAWDVELNKAYKNLKSQENPAQQEALLKSEKQWMKYRDSEFIAIGKIYTEQGQGSEARPWASFARTDVVKERAIELQNRTGDNTNGAIGERVQGQTYAEADAALNKSYNALMPLLNKSGQNSLLNTEREWLKFRDAEFELIDKSTDSRFEGSRMESLRAKTDVVLKRANRLQRQLELNSGVY